MSNEQESTPHTTQASFTSSTDHARPESISAAFPDLSHLDDDAREMALRYLALNAYLSAALAELERVAALTQEAAATGARASARPLAVILTRQQAAFTRMFEGIEETLHSFGLCSSLRMVAQWNVDQRLSHEEVHAVWEATTEILRAEREAAGTAHPDHPVIAAAALPQRISEAGLAFANMGVVGIQVRDADGNPLDDQQAEEIVSFLRSLSGGASQPPDPFASRKRPPTSD